MPERHGRPHHVEGAAHDPVPLCDVGEQLIDVVVHGDDDAAAGDRTARRVHVPLPHCGHRGAEPEVDAEPREVAHDRIGGRAGVGLQIALDVRSTDEAQQGRLPRAGEAEEHDDLAAGHLQRGPLECSGRPEGLRHAVEADEGVGCRGGHVVAPVVS